MIPQSPQFPPKDKIELGLRFHVFLGGGGGEGEGERNSHQTMSPLSSHHLQS